MTYPAVHIRKGREKSLQRFHPWVFSGSVLKQDDGIKDGDLVSLVDFQGRSLGVGHYSTGSISVKVLSHTDVQLDEKWLLERFTKATELRSQLGFPSESTNAYRLIHGEGDALPGLIVDVYNKTAVVQPHSVGMERTLKGIADALMALGFENIVHKPTSRAKAQVLRGAAEERTPILEQGMRLNVDVLTGQKTGFFIDQRDNRDLVSTYAKDKSVLNVFSYTGGFSIAALKGGAKSAISLDGSSSALTLADENAQLNDFGAKHQSLKADAVPYLEGMTEQYDMIVLDPPAFAKHKSARHNAIQAYRRINEAALKQISPGGMLFTFSCSQVIDRQLFYDTVASAAINAGRMVRVLHHLRQPADHPVSIYHPEGEYLKGLALVVD